MTGRNRYVAVGTVISLLIVMSSNAQEHSPKDLDDARPEDTLLVYLVDELGRPVPNARVGFSACYGDASFTNSNWHYLPDPGSLDPSPSEVLSDEQGIARIPQGMRIRSTYPVSLIARNEEMRLIGVKRVDRDSDSEVFLTMAPECRVTGELACRSLVDAGEKLHHINLNVHHNGVKFLVEYYSTAPEFELFLPAGSYNLASHGSSNGTLNMEWELVVPPGVASMGLYSIELTLSARRHLIGQPAPELEDVIAWKSDGTTSLADLRGKVVLLDFWGYWCAACISGIPKLIALHENYSDQGLVFLGVHLDSGGRITSLESYLDFEQALTNGTLAGRKIPYPVVLVGDRPNPHEGVATREPKHKVAADYGVESYPTMILIDRDGRVAGQFRHTTEGIATLQSLLAEPRVDD